MIEFSLSFYFENMNYIEGLAQFENQVPDGLLQDMERMATLLDVPGRLVDRFGNELNAALVSKKSHLEVPLLAADISGQLAQVMDLTPEQRGALTERAHKADSSGFVPGFAPRTLPKTMNEMFGAVPQFVGDGDILQWGEAGLIDQTIVRGASLTKTALNALGLPLPDSRLRVDQMSERHAQVPAVRDMFKSGLEPLGLPHEELDVPGCSRFFRLFRVTEGPRKGMIFGTRREKKEKLIPFGTDLNGAIRMFEHIREDYQDGDILKLAHLSTAIRNITKEVTEDWKKVRDSGRLQEVEAELNALADGLSEKLKNEHKKIIKRHFDGCRTFIDSKGRLNPNAHLCRLNVAGKSIAKRMAQVHRILSYHSENSLRLKMHARLDNALAGGLYRSLEIGAGGVDVLLDKDAPIENKKAVLADLDSLERSLSGFRFEPYVGFADEIIGNLIMARELLQGDNVTPEQRELIQKAVVESYTLARLIRLENGVMDLVENWRGGSGYMLGRLNVVIEQLSQHRVAPDVKVDRFNVLYMQAKHSIIGIRNLLRESYRLAAIDIERSEQLRGEARALLKEFSVAKMLKQIS